MERSEGGVIGAMAERTWLRHAVTLAVYLLFWIAWSWPLATDPFRLQVAQQFDNLGSIWVSGLGPRLDGGWVTYLAGWPEGEDIRRMDTFVLIGLSWLVGNWVAPVSLLGLVTMLGPPLSALAAERFAARVLSVGWPWSIAAGLTYGFSGLAVTSLLEGHAYALFNPWLPLMAWQWAETTGPHGRPWHAVATAVLWAACLLTSAYMGIVATLWLAGWAIWAFWHPTPAQRRALVTVALIVPMGAIYTGLFVAGGDATRPQDAYFGERHQAGGITGAADLAGFAGATYLDDGASAHPTVTALGFLPLVLVAVALARRRRLDGPWQPMLWLGLAGLALSLGAVLKVDASDEGIPWLLAPIRSLLANGFFRFPARLAILAALGWGAVGAAALAGLARHSRLAAVLLPLVALDILVTCAIPVRTARVTWAVPSALRALPEEGAVLPLLPHLTGISWEHEQCLNDRDCAYQAELGRPLVNRCTATTLRHGPRWELGSWLRSALLEEVPGDEIAGHLASLGIGAVIWRPGLFAPADRLVIARALTGALGEPIASSQDAGEYLVVYRVDDPAALEAAQEAWARLASGADASPAPFRGEVGASGEAPP